MDKASQTVAAQPKARTRMRTLAPHACVQAPESAKNTDKTAQPCEQLTTVLLQDDPKDGLWDLVNSGWASKHLPELPALKLQQNPAHRHKEILAHTIIVTGQAPARLRVRLAALFHDIGKPATRKFSADGVTFRDHEAVGAEMTALRMPEMGFDPVLTAQVTKLVALSGRFKGYGASNGWSDTAVRRYVRDAGALLDDLNDLVRSDCTSRHQHKVQALHDSLDDLIRRISAIKEAEIQAAVRPELDGARVMEILGIAPGPEVGAAMKFLLHIRRTEGLIGLEEAEKRLIAWRAERP